MTLAETLLSKQPWLITPDALRAMAATAQTLLSGSFEIPTPALSSSLAIEDGVGVIAICGPMIRRPDPVSRFLFGAVDTEEITAAVRETANRPDIKAIFLDIDSPGGTVTGTPELAQAVADAGKEKPVYAFSSGLMCSAAYWVGSQAQAVYVTPSARVGSIGVIQPIIDDSEAFKSAGLKVEVFAAGKFKGIGMPGVALTDAQREFLQSSIAETAADFHAAVLARGRKIPPEAMEGQDFSGKQAQRLNLAGVVRDRVDAMARLRSYHVAYKTQARNFDTAPVAMKSLEDQLAEALARVQSLESDAQASANQLSEVSAQTDALRTQLTAVIGERDQATADFLVVQRSIETLTDRNKDLEAREQDIEKRVALRSAQVIASTGTNAPAKVSVAGESESQVTEEKTPAELIARYSELVATRQPKAAAEFYERHLKPLFNH